MFVRPRWKVEYCRNTLVLVKQRMDVWSHADSNAAVTRQGRGFVLVLLTPMKQVIRCSKAGAVRCSEGFDDAFSLSESHATLNPLV